MNPHSIHSYHRYMREYLLDHVDIPERNIHILRGDLPRQKCAEHCAAFERAIAEAGGIDLQLLGIGRSGHIGFNEPGSGRESAIRALQTVGIEVKSIRDVTPIPHNGCRPTKRRRV